MLVLTGIDVETLLDLDELVEAVAVAMVDVSAGRASMPARIAAAVPERRAVLAAMPAFLPSTGALATKLVSLFPENRDRPTHQAIICLFDSANGTPVAIMDGTYITAARTAAGSALATRLLARPGAHIVAVIGTGVQAHAHVRALARNPGVDVIRLAGRDHGKASALISELAGAVGVAVEAVLSIEEAVRSADVVCLTTHAGAPVIHREWLRPGTHVNSVGYNFEGTGEVDAETIRDALVVVESRDSALAPPPAGAVELLRAIDSGLISRDEVRCELGQLVANEVPGRTSDTQITLYKSVGIAAQDAAAAALVFAAARERGIGTRIDL